MGDEPGRTLCRPDDPLLLGYFLVDDPAWARHPTGAGWEGPLAEIAQAYATAAIRRHDPDHLLLGDRFGTRAGGPGRGARRRGRARGRHCRSTRVDAEIAEIACPAAGVASSGA